MFTVVWLCTQLGLESKMPSLFIHTDSRVNSVSLPFISLLADMTQSEGLSDQLWLASFNVFIHIRFSELSPIVLAAVKKWYSVTDFWNKKK